MAQTIYTSARNVDVRKCEPQQLLRQNYLSEFRTEVEKAKARESLGIPDDISLIWGNIKGFISQQEDLVNYIKDSFNYTVENYNDIKSVQEALTYLFQVVTDYVKHKEDFLISQEEINKCLDEIKTLQGAVGTFLEGFTIVQSKVNTLESDMGEVQQLSATNKQLIGELKDSFNNTFVYSTELPDNLTVYNTVGGIQKGTKVSDLEGHSINDIIDQLLFPTVVNDPIRPSISLTPQKQLLEINSNESAPVLRFTQNDAGPIINQKLIVVFKGQTYDSLSKYDQVGTYEYQGTITYSDGEPMVDNKGQVVPDKYIKGGTLTAKAVVNVTYPWFAGNTKTLVKQDLVEMGKASGDIELNLSGNSVIKIPGLKSKINSFQVNGGSGWLAVNIEGAWDYKIEQDNNIYYQVWTKKKSEEDALPYIINFTLIE